MGRPPAPAAKIPLTPLFSRSYSHAPVVAPVPGALQHNWAVVDGYVVFKTEATEGTTASKAIPSLELINNALVYAKELERIV